MLDRRRNGQLVVMVKQLGHAGAARRCRGGVGRVTPQAHGCHPRPASMAGDSLAVGLVGRLSRVAANVRGRLLASTNDYTVHDQRQVLISRRKGGMKNSGSGTMADETACRRRLARRRMAQRWYRPPLEAARDRGACWRSRSPAAWPTIRPLATRPTPTDDVRPDDRRHAHPTSIPITSFKAGVNANPVTYRRPAAGAARRQLSRSAAAFWPRPTAARSPTASTCCTCKAHEFAVADGQLRTSTSRSTRRSPTVTRGTAAAVHRRHHATRHRDGHRCQRAFRTARR